MHISSSKKKVGTSVLELRPGNSTSLQFVQGAQYYKFEDISFCHLVCIFKLGDC